MEGGENYIEEVCWKKKGSAELGRRVAKTDITEFISYYITFKCPLKVM